MKAEVLRLINRLKRVANFPVFAETVKTLRALRTEEEATADRLVRLVLFDPGLCCQILRAGNSVFYNPYGYPLKTISRAVVIMGLQHLRFLAEGAPVFKEEQLEDPNLAQELTISLVAAHLAGKAASKRNLNAEETYLAALFRRLGRLVLLLFAPGYYEKAKGLDPRRKKEIFYLVGERLAKQWNLPENVIQCLEGRELHLRPKRMAHLCLYADLLAAGLVTGKGPLGWQNLFTSFAEVKQVLKTLDRAPCLPVALRKYWPSKIGEEKEEESFEVGPFLPEEALRLAQKVLATLCEETGAEGKLFYREGPKIFAVKEDNPPEGLEALLEKDEITFAENRIYIPIKFKKTPALLLSLECESPLPPEELYGLKLVRKTLEGLLERL